MNRIDERFAAIREAKGTALIPFLTIGDPDKETSVEIILEMEKAGADIIELGVPYSDPLADGPVIQRSSSRALKHRISIVDVIETAGECRSRGCQLPFILFTYYNPVLRLGFDRFFRLLAENDISGMIIPDMPVEENEEIRTLGQRHGVHFIPLVAPTSNDRIAKITATAAGFVYCVSSLGVTGTRTSFYGGIEDFLENVRHATNLPVAVGFGISNREQVLGFSGKCDGVIVGSAIVRKIEEVQMLLESASTKREGLAQIREFVRELKA